MTRRLCASDQAAVMGYNGVSTLLYGLDYQILPRTILHHTMWQLAGHLERCPTRVQNRDNLLSHSPVDWINCLRIAVDVMGKISQWSPNQDINSERVADKRLRSGT